MPEFEGKKFQNVAKEGLEFSDETSDQKEQFEEMVESYKDLTTWLTKDALSGLIEKAVVSNRLSESPCALVAGQYGWWVWCGCGLHVITVLCWFAGLVIWNAS